jgi:hypothetical protein
MGPILVFQNSKIAAEPDFPKRRIFKETFQPHFLIKYYFALPCKHYLAMQIKLRQVGTYVRVKYVRPLRHDIKELVTISRQLRQKLALGWA